MCCSFTVRSLKFLYHCQALQLLSSPTDLRGQDNKLPLSGWHSSFLLFLSFTLSVLTSHLSRWSCCTSKPITRQCFKWGWQQPDSNRPSASVQYRMQLWWSDCLSLSGLWENEHRVLPITPPQWAKPLANFTSHLHHDCITHCFFA